MPFWEMRQYEWTLSEEREERMSESPDPYNLGPDDHAYRLLMMDSEEEEQRRRRERRRLEQLGSGSASSSRSDSQRIRRRNKLKGKEEEKEKGKEEESPEEEWNLEDPLSLSSEEFESLERPDLEGFVDDSFIQLKAENKDAKGKEEETFSSPTPDEHRRRTGMRSRVAEGEPGKTIEPGRVPLSSSRSSSGSPAAPPAEGWWAWLRRKAAELRGKPASSTPARSSSAGHPLGAVVLPRRLHLSPKHAGSPASAAPPRSASEMMAPRREDGGGWRGPSEQPPPLSAASWAEFNTLESKRKHEGPSSEASSEAFHSLEPAHPASKEEHRQASPAFLSPAPGREADPDFRIEDYGGAAPLATEWEGLSPPPGRLLSRTPKKEGRRSPTSGMKRTIEEEGERGRRASTSSTPASSSAASSLRSEMIPGMKTEKKKKKEDPSPQAPPLAAESWEDFDSADSAEDSEPMGEEMTEQEIEWAMRMTTSPTTPASASASAPSSRSDSQRVVEPANPASSEEFHREESDGDVSGSDDDDRPDYWW